MSEFDRSGYGDLVEPWKLRLVISRARRLGFPKQEWEDLQQEVILDVLAFQFDPTKAGAESTPLAAVIDNRLRDLRRRRHRDDVRQAVRNEMHGLHQGKRDKELALSYLEPLGRRADMLAALASLNDRQLSVCLGLIQGMSFSRIGKSLGCNWHTVKRAVADIRRRFRRLGMDGWMS